MAQAQDWAALRLCRLQLGCLSAKLLQQEHFDGHPSPSFCLVLLRRVSVGRRLLSYACGDAVESCMCICSN